MITVEAFKGTAAPGRRCDLHSDRTVSPSWTALDSTDQLAWYADAWIWAPRPEHSPPGPPVGGMKRERCSWLGTATIAPRYVRYRPFRDARRFVWQLRLRDVADWRRYVASGKKPADIPSNPGNTYGDAFLGFGDWLGTGRTVQRWRSFRKARAFVRTRRLRSQFAWYAFARSRRRPRDIPAAPQCAYKVEWKGWNDWLGTRVKRPING
jgi:hypothetical protein